MGFCWLFSFLKNQDKSSPEMSLCMGMAWPGLDWRLGVDLPLSPWKSPSGPKSNTAWRSTLQSSEQTPTPESTF